MLLNETAQFRYEGEESAIATCKTLHELLQAFWVLTEHVASADESPHQVRISVATAQTLVLILDDAVATVGALENRYRMSLQKRSILSRF